MGLSGHLPPNAAGEAWFCCTCFTCLIYDVWLGPQFICNCDMCHSCFSDFNINMGHEAILTPGAPLIDLPVSIMSILRGTAMGDSSTQDGGWLQLQTNLAIANANLEGQQVACRDPMTPALIGSTWIKTICPKCQSVLATLKEPSCCPFSWFNIQVSGSASRPPQGPLALGTKQSKF